MKLSIEGFNQKEALKFKKEVSYKNKTKTIKLDCTDLTILRWFVDFYPNMNKMIVDGKEYAWLKHSKLAEDLPLLDIMQKSYIERMKKLVEFNILGYKLLKKSGTYSLYCFGDNYINLVKNSERVAGQPDEGSWSTILGVVGQPDTGVAGQPDNKDSNIIYSNIKNNNISCISKEPPKLSNADIIRKVIEYMNKCGALEENFKNKKEFHYNPNGANNKKLITARIKEGYTLDNFKDVIYHGYEKFIENEQLYDKTPSSTYYRPGTLFSSENFENYLNQYELKYGGKNGNK